MHLNDEERYVVHESDYYQVELIEAADEEDTLYDEQAYGATYEIYYAVVNKEYGVPELFTPRKIEAIQNAEAFSQYLREEQWRYFRKTAAEGDLMGTDPDTVPTH